ncbi:MAG: DUF2179 domain-containing protein [Methanoregulaceae archaeon]|jgi:uncharacterized protein YebE (UPF0316 family)|nr:DUF2179 domain-containing protein [Methanoregulaceae archaeon]MCC7468271.1 DUF2179 domain-containing protein [Burkholderiaceae bacterium]NLH25914.1 DUF2179 domain-containing protein [Methanomicrobiales archaeon]HNL86225.1 DUF2179 domain-containing protein [Methanoregulaceae archaeon]HPA06885.1 DUF2179 domain-containing protein [Methanoregulaceae archaeon]
MADPVASSDLFAWVILPLLIFFFRICDVSLGTIRVIFIAKGLKYIAPVIGFFEVIIWLLAIGQVMNNISNVACYIAYGGGFAAGTLLGMTVEEKLSLGTVVVRVISNEDITGLLLFLRAHSFGVTIAEGEGSKGKVKIILSVIKRQDLDEVVRGIQHHLPGTFYSVEEIKSVAEGVFPEKKSRLLFNHRDPFGFFRKGK